VVAVVPRLVLGLSGVWAETALALPPGEWRNVLTREKKLAGKVTLVDLLRRFPVALLARE
jgi:(1->4)-alpha-D-glucan 1-alpha-D-glucosylmutase